MDGGSWSSPLFNYLGHVSNLIKKFGEFTVVSKLLYRIF